MLFDDDTPEILSRTQLIEELQTLQSRLAELESLSNENFIRSIAEENFVCIGVVYKNEKYLYVNPAITKLTGYSYDELMKTIPLTTVHEDDISSTKDRAVKRLSEGNPPSQYETRIRSKNGDIKWLEISTSPINFQGQEAALAIAFDITERKQAEEALRRSDERYRTLVNASWNLVWIADANGMLTESYTKKGYFTGHSNKDVLGMRWLDFVHAEDRERVKGTWLRCILTGEGYEAEYRILNGAGDSRHVFVKSVPVRSDEGEIIEWVGTLTDVTEQKLSEQKLRQKEEQLAEARKMEAIGHLAGGVAHNFNNMLTVIANYAQILLGQIEPEHHSYSSLKGIEKATNRCVTLTNQLLAFGRKQFLNPKEIDLNDLITGLNTQIKRLCGKDIQFSISLNSSQAIINADPEKIEQCLLTIIAKSCDDLNNGGTLKIETSFVKVKDPQSIAQDFFSTGDYALITISDNGVGMSEEALAGLFEPFFFFKSTQPNKGLEMASVYGIIKQSSGHITVESVINKGTTYKIYIPLSKTDTTQKHETETPPSPNTKTILLVDDEEQVREIVEVLLNTIGYETLSAESGESALRIAREFPEVIHLLMTDMSMPQMNGLTLAEKMKSLRPDIRVVIMSGDSEWIVGENLSLGDLAFLQKPFSLQELRRKIKEILG